VKVEVSPFFKEILVSKWLAVFVATISFLIVVIFWNGLVKSEQIHIQQKINSDAKNLTAGIRVSYLLRISRLIHMSKVWEVTGKPVKQEWSTNAAIFIAHQRGIQAIEWIDPEFIVRWMVPMIGNEGILGKNLGVEPARKKIMLESRKTREIIATPSLNLFQGGEGFLVFVPIFLFNGQFDGYIVGVFKTKDIFQSILNRLNIKNYTIVIKFFPALKIS